ncbi:MAG: hypothetical protein Q7J57_12740 [Gemmobacter sp.]|nr:hypothetical protein [Gemmobacter sp.]
MAEHSKTKGTKAAVIGRRGFFGAAAAAVTGAALTQGGATPAFATETGDERTRARYQETDHVKRFYTVNRYYKGE